jgi:hypothetical protein
MELVNGLAFYTNVDSHEIAHTIITICQKYLAASSFASVELDILAKYF